MATTSQESNIEPELAVETPSKHEDKSSQMGFFNISSVARTRIEAKRKRKGLGDIKKREKDVFAQFFVHGVSFTAACSMIAPLERSRIIL